MPLDLGVHEGPQDVRGERQVDVDELRLLVQAVQGEVVSEFHNLDHVLLLQARANLCTGPSDVLQSICIEHGHWPVLTSTGVNTKHIQGPVNSAKHLGQLPPLPHHSPDLDTHNS